jgi:hypothetical protein
LCFFSFLFLFPPPHFPSFFILLFLFSL